MSRMPRDPHETNSGHAALPEPPQPATPRRSVWPLVFAAILAMFASGVLLLLTLGMFGLMLAVAAMVFLFVAMHYIVWGRWLGDAIRRDVAEEEAAEALRAAQRTEESPPTP